VKGGFWKRHGHGKEVRCIAAGDLQHTAPLYRRRFQTAKTGVGGQLIRVGLAIGITRINNRVIGSRNGFAHSSSLDLRHRPEYSVRIDRDELLHERFGTGSTAGYRLRAGIVACFGEHENL
jgi:hypothetical protein